MKFPGKKCTISRQLFWTSHKEQFFFKHGDVDVISRSKIALFRLIISHFQTQKLPNFRLPFFNTYLSLFSSVLTNSGFQCSLPERKKNNSNCAN